jgi:FkbM family methyltransferase
MNPAPLDKKEPYRRIDWFERASESLGKIIGPGRFRRQLRAAYHQLLLLRSGSRGLRCDLPEGESVRILPAYRFASWSLVEYEAFKKAVRPGGVVLDIGANVGAYSLLFGQWVGPAGRVFAFEPATEAFAALSRHVHMNRLDGVVSPQRLAISDRTATLEFSADSSQGTNRLLSEQEAGGGPAPIKVQAQTIDEFCAQHNLRPDFIKIDVEGFELAALRGGRQTLRACRDQLALFVEMHPAIWERIGISRQDILDELDLQGLRAEPLLAGEGDPWASGVCLQLVFK